MAKASQASFAEIPEEAMTADPSHSEHPQTEDMNQRPAEERGSNGTAMVKAPAGANGKSLAKADTATPIPMEGHRLTPRHSDDLGRMARLALAAGLAPKGSKNVEQVIMGIAAGMEAGLSFVQSCRYVMVVNGMPSLWGDGPLGLVADSGQLEDIQVARQGENDNLTYTVTVKRRGIETPQVGWFSVAAAKRAGLWGKSGPWSQYPERMLELRARAFAIRNLFPDKLMGLGIAEEADDGEAKRADELTRNIEGLTDEPK